MKTSGRIEKPGKPPRRQGRDHRPGKPRTRGSDHRRQAMPIVRLSDNTSRSHRRLQRRWTQHLRMPHRHKKLSHGFRSLNSSAWSRPLFIYEVRCTEEVTDITTWHFPERRCLVEKDIDPARGCRPEVRTIVPDQRKVVYASKGNPSNNSWTACRVRPIASSARLRSDRKVEDEDISRPCILLLYA